MASGKGGEEEACGDQEGRFRAGLCLSPASLDLTLDLFQWSESREIVQTVGSTSIVRAVSPCHHQGLFKIVLFPCGTSHVSNFILPNSIYQVIIALFSLFIKIS